MKLFKFQMLCLLFIQATAAFSADNFFNVNSLAGQTIRNFSYPEYDAQGQPEREISGDQLQILPEGIFKVTNLKLSTYENGRKAMNIATPICLYNRIKRTAVTTAEVYVVIKSEIFATGQGGEFDEKNGKIRLDNNVKVVMEKTRPKKNLGKAMDSEIHSMDGGSTNRITITSTRLTGDIKTSFAVFEGNVVANVPLTRPPFKIESDRLTVFFSNDKKKEALEAFEAEGRITITADTFTANARKAVYGMADGKVILSGSPSVTRELNRLTAETIVYWRDSGRILCEPKAHLTIYSAQDLRDRSGKN